MSCSYIWFTSKKTYWKEIANIQLSENFADRITMKICILFLIVALVSATLVDSEKTCDGKPDGGVCDAYFPKWYYNMLTGHCYMFIYGGCGGNGNKYDTEQECLDSCKGV
ncbi:hypothetical protein AVEN_62095-1 [Araneus ventricosus]|uniref:BPTI/Kunitz inhibitor domain-containing protein n=1 Tax=Araneus ventricosus TaxID=182803 RepID=A0A4Y2SXF1_ARAVE|nr:hypothetical protein AVEN_88867-1 [Araneus ventricosus]GBN91830.1 hypothetical protein AVEN_248162-1 [Araneus ventricosus]GBN91849.1 hypothetical protein AVEN_229625-1 [Araneus ventricosus]GBN91850.1 hypothetical protein AVEN_62095-1 [Araneus ventricosus]